MFIDARSFSQNTVAETGVCIIGAGAAGISMALSLRSAGFPVAVLESGNFDFELPTQNLYAGEMAGIPNYPLDSSRLRFSGEPQIIGQGHAGRSTPRISSAARRSR